MAAVLLACVLASTAACADVFNMDGVSATLASTSTTTTEGTPLTLDYNFQNNSGADVTLLNVGLLSPGIPALVSGDASDKITSIIYHECSGTIANGSSCTFSITFNSAADTGMDHDSGVWDVTSGVQVFFTNNAFQTSFTSEVTIMDPVAATPEPSSLLMLGTGLLGLVGTLRKWRS